MNENERKEYYITLRTILGATLAPTMTDDEIINRIKTCSQALIYAISTGDPVEDSDDGRENVIDTEDMRYIRVSIEANKSYTFNELLSCLYKKRHSGWNRRCDLLHYAIREGWLKQEPWQEGSMEKRYTLNI